MPHQEIIFIKNNIIRTRCVSTRYYIAIIKEVSSNSTHRSSAAFTHWKLLLGCIISHFTQAAQLTKQKPKLTVELSSGWHATLHIFFSKHTADSTLSFIPLHFSDVIAFWWLTSRAFRPCLTHLLLVSYNLHLVFFLPYCRICLSHLL